MYKFTGILMFCDSVAALFSYVLGHYLRLGDMQDLNTIGDVPGLQAMIYALVVLISGYFCELYAADRTLLHTELAARIAVSIMVAFLFLSACFYAAPEMALGRGVLSLALLIFGVMQYMIHLVCHSFQMLPRFAIKIMILGTGPLAEVIRRTIPLSTQNYAFAGFIQPLSGMPVVEPDQIVGTVDQIEDILFLEKVDKLIISMTERRGVLPVKNLLTCKLRGVEILDSPTFYEQLTGKLLVEDIQPSWFIYSNGFRFTSARRAWKRVLDIVLAFMGILLVLPFLPIVAVLIKLSSPGPVLFRQLRVGERGREFTLIKFRTMCDDAEKETGPVWASENDPRITRLGGWLRKARIDEIPQLFNVLMGDMSFIGPRPERKEFVERLSEKIPYYGKRHFLKPGVTGWAQIKYPYGASDEDALEKLRYDLYYIKNYSLTLDLMIILETIKVVLFGRGGR
ncbi:MAG: TIGR03013 family XrtA/PEP-CTERM system glycosyltransferase [Desulfuromonadales bacterium]